MSDVNEWIKERRRIREHALTPDERADTEYAYPALLTAVEKVLELHKPVESMHGDYLCSTCAERDNCTVAMDWPCATVRAIEGAIK